jgi:hypothetical protein
VITRSESTVQSPINVVGSSTFGVYPKISIEKTYNMYISDGWLVDYLGYKSISNLGTRGRGIFTSTILNRMIAVIDENVYLINVIFDPNSNDPYQFNPLQIGTLLTFTSDVFIAENNGGQIAISDGSAIYIYNPNAAIPFQTFNSAALGFIPGYITFHDTYFIAAASQDAFYTPPANNTWRLSASNDGTSWPADEAHIGLLQTKPDNTAAVLRFPSRGNMIFVMGTTVTEPWFDVGYQLFPYQRNTNANIDYGCISPATIAATDELVVWLAKNEKSGPVIVFSDGGMVQRISSDGIDNVLGGLQNPESSEAFIFRADGHIFYHINFYGDNLTLFYDFNTQKFFHASDHNMNYFIAKEVAFFNNQYYFVSRNDGNIYAFSTAYTTYDGKEIPRIRVCKSIRRPTQENFIVNDVGFTIEQGTTEPIYHNLGPAHLITQADDPLITEDINTFFITQANDLIVTEDGFNLVEQEDDFTAFDFLITDQDVFSGPIYPRVDMSISIDGGYSFGSYVSYNMNPLGKRKNMLRWWRLGLANDWTPQFRFWGFGRFVATDGIANIRE